MRRNTDNSPTIRSATLDDLDNIIQLSKLCAAGPVSGKDAGFDLAGGNDRHSRSRFRERILDRCLLLAEKQDQLCAVVGLDLDKSAIGELIARSNFSDHELIEKLLLGTERLAVKFGLRQLQVTIPLAAKSLFLSLGYKPFLKSIKGNEIGSSEPGLSLQRSLLRRLTHQARRVRSICNELGIPENYGQVHRISVQAEASRLAGIGTDIYGREQQLTPLAAAAWNALKDAAVRDEIELQAVSAWRSVDYQANLLRRKLKKGLQMEEILKVSAAPGYSEHHTGLAIDITSPGFATLEEEFENSAAFRWLEDHAGNFGFRLSFPRNNRHGLAYEPWHWCFRSPRP